MSGARPLVFAVVDQAVRSAFHADLAREVKRRVPALFHLYSPSEVSAEQQRRRFGDVYDSFNVIDRGEQIPRDPENAEAILARAHAYEERYGIPLGWFRVTDRHAGLGFAPGGFYHPRSRLSEKATDLGVIANYVRILDFWEHEIKKKGIEVVINGFYFESYPARANGAQVRTALSARNENYYYWADSCLGTIEGLAKVFARTPPPERDEIIALEDAPVLNRKTLDVIATEARLGSFLHRLWRVALKHAYNRYKNPEKQQYYFTSDVAYVYRSWRTLRRLYGKRLAQLDDLKKHPYVLYALQVEPESNLQGSSPEYFYQLAAITSLARDLPAGIKLAVKEHLPAAGRRPRDFYAQIALLKNVVLVDLRERGLDLVRHARAVATISGTVGQEAAVLGKPVLSFGRHNLYNILDHVRVIDHEEALAPALRWALSDEFDTAKAKADGQRYLRALRTISFDMADFGFHNPKGYTEESVRQASIKLLESLRDMSTNAMAGHVSWGRMA